LHLPLSIAWRYLRRPTDRLVSAVGFVSVLGLVIGVTALVISMALMTGYREDLQRKLLAGNAEIFVYSLSGPIEEGDRQAAELENVPGVATARAVVFQAGLVSSEETPTGEQVMLKGIAASHASDSPMLQRVIGERRFRYEGDAGISIGRQLAAKLKVEPGDALTLTVPAEAGSSFLPKSATFLVTHAFRTGFHEFDSRWVFVDVEDARALVGLGEGANLLEVHLEPGADLDAVRDAIRSHSGGTLAVTDWREMNRQLFSLLAIQQLVLFIVIGLIVFVSTFNIVSTLIMTVHEKRKEIGILASMGADSSLLRRIFVYYGTLVGVIGTGSGILIGVVSSWVITKFELVSFGPEIAEVYFVSSIPFVTRARDLLMIALFSVGVSFFATIVPSMRAARLNPADALRYE
jgi:lipoprotein-releasing system permease protein